MPIGPLEDIQPVIQVDTREPEVGTWSDYFTTPYVRQALPTGDFALCGCSDMIAIERKTLDDLIGCLTIGRERFTAELRRAQHIASFYVIVEASYRDILGGNFRSQMNRKAAWESVVALSLRYRIPFLFAGDQKTAARLCESILIRWFKEHKRAVEAAMRGARQAAG